MNEEDYLEDSNCLKGPYYSVLSVRVIVTSVHKQLIVEGEIEDDGGNVFFLGVADAKKAATFYQAERSVIDDIINMEKRYYTGAASWIEVPNVGIFDWYETNLANVCQVPFSGLME